MPTFVSQLAQLPLKPLSLQILQWLKHTVEVIVIQIKQVGQDLGTLVHESGVHLSAAERLQPRLHFRYRWQTCRSWFLQYVANTAPVRQRV